MTYLTVPRPYMNGRLTESIPIYMDEVTAEDRLKDGRIRLIPGVQYPQHIEKVANTYSN